MLVRELLASECNIVELSVRPLQVAALHQVGRSTRFKPPSVFKPSVRRQRVTRPCWFYRAPPLAPWPRQAASASTAVPSGLHYMWPDHPPVRLLKAAIIKSPRDLTLPLP